MDYEEFHAHIHDRLREEHGIHDPVVTYSATSKDDPDELDRVAAKGTVQFFLDHEDFWGAGDNYISPVVQNPTWLQVAALADQMIRTTGDSHHIFFEGIRQAEPKTKQKHLRFGRSTYRNRDFDVHKNVTQYTFLMGS